MTSPVRRTQRERDRELIAGVNWYRTFTSDHPCHDGHRRADRRAACGTCAAAARELNRIAAEVRKGAKR